MVNRAEVHTSECCVDDNAAAVGLSEEGHSASEDFAVSETLSLGYC